MFVTCVSFPLPTILFTPKQQAIMVTTNLISCLGSPTAFFRRLSKELRCLLWSSGMNMSWQTTQKFPPIADEEFLAETRVLAALNKIASSYLKKEFQRDARRFLEEFTTSVPSTVAARSKIGQGLSCFCPAILIGGDDLVPLHLLGFLLDGLLERGWIKGGDIEACRAEY